MEIKVVVRLSDGERIALTDAEVRLVYDELWLRGTNVLGAVSAAGIIEYARRGSSLVGLAREIALSEPQTEVFREALVRVREP
jgi:hypothetical protein